MRSIITIISSRDYADRVFELLKSIVNTPENIDCNRQHDLTIEEIKTYAMFAHFSDEEARKVAETLKHFSQIVYNFYQKNKEKMSEFP